MGYNGGSSVNADDFINLSERIFKQAQKLECMEEDLQNLYNIIKIPKRDRELEEKYYELKELGDKIHEEAKLLYIELHKGYISYDNLKQEYLAITKLKKSVGKNEF